MLRNFKFMREVQEYFGSLSGFCSGCKTSQQSPDQFLMFADKHDRGAGMPNALAKSCKALHYCSWNQRKSPADLALGVMITLVDKPKMRKLALSHYSCRQSRSQNFHITSKPAQRGRSREIQALGLQICGVRALRRHNNSWLQAGEFGEWQSAVGGCQAVIP